MADVSIEHEIIAFVQDSTAPCERPLTPYILVPTYEYFELLPIVITRARENVNVLPQRP